MHPLSQEKVNLSMVYPLETVSTTSEKKTTLGNLRKHNEYAFWKLLRQEAKKKLPYTPSKPFPDLYLSLSRIVRQARRE